MGGVDKGDQLRGYYAPKLKCRNFYKYIVNFLVGVALTNSYILHLSRAGSKLSLKKFQELAAKQLIGGYCSRRKAGRVSYPIRRLSLLHFPQKGVSSTSDWKQGRCVLCQEKHKRTDTQWSCNECGIWLCHP